MTGHSWVDYFKQGSKSGEQGIYGDDFWQGWELHYMAGLRNGKWKILWMPKEVPTGKDRWELFDLSTDPGETNDLSKQHPEILSKMQGLFDR